MKKTYLIEFKVIHANCSVTQKKCKMKNCESSAQAQFKLEKHLKTTIEDFGQLIVINCKEDFMFENMFEDSKTSNLFNDIFGFNKKK